MRLRSFLSLLFLFLASTALADREQGVAFRGLLHDLIDAGSRGSASDRAEAFRIAVGKRPELLPLLIDESAAQQLIQDAGLAEALTIVSEKNTLHEALQEAAETEFLAIARKSPLTRDIPHYKIKKQFDEFLRQGKRPEMREIMQELAAYFAGLPWDERKKILDQVPDAVFEQASARIDDWVERARFSRTPSLQLILEEVENGTLPGLSAQDKALLKEAFLAYFDDIPLSSKRRILKAWVLLPPGSSRETQLAEVLRSSGPVFQKIFQLVGRGSKSPQMRSITKELLSNVPPFPGSEARQLIERESGRSINQLFSHFSDEPIAAGTVGQVHQAKLRDGRDVAVKVLRPGVREQMKSDFAAFHKATRKIPAAAELVERLEQNFMAELDFLTEAENLRKGRAYTSPKLGTVVPSVIDEIAPTGNLLVMDLAEGKPLSALTDLDPRIKGQAYYNLLKRWFEEVMFGSGFFHGDLHPGNVMLKEIPKGKPPFRLTIIDLGSAGEMSLEKRRNFVRFFSAVVSRATEDTLDALSGFGEVPEESKSAIRKEAERILASKASPFEKANEILGAALRNGIDLDPALVMFNRANLFLYNELKKTNAEILVRYPKAKTFKPLNAYMVVALKNAGIEIPKHLLGRSQESVVETEVLRKFFVAQFRRLEHATKSNCAAFFSRFRDFPEKR